MNIVKGLQNCAGCKELYLVKGNGLYWMDAGIIAAICLGCFKDITDGWSKK
jgi:hypothetical protein